MSTLIKKRCAKKRPGEASFTLLETIIALGLLTYLILQVASVQGNAVVFSEYGGKVMQATYLAKRILSQVEYYSTNQTLKEMEYNVKDVPFEDAPEFKYSLEIKEWKLPIMQLLTGGGLGGSDENKADAGGGINQMIKDAAKQVLGDDLLKTASVEVSWAEGAKRNTTVLTYLLTNQKKVDDLIGTLKATGGGVPGAPGGAGPRAVVPGGGAVPNPGGANPITPGTPATSVPGPNPMPPP